jgi:hypothetical protein
MEFPKTPRQHPRQRLAHVRVSFGVVCGSGYRTKAIPSQPPAMREGASARSRYARRSGDHMRGSAACLAAAPAGLNCRSRPSTSTSSSSLWRSPHELAAVVRPVSARPRCYETGGVPRFDRLIRRQPAQEIMDRTAGVLALPSDGLQSDCDRNILSPGTMRARVTGNKTFQISPVRLGIEGSLPGFRHPPFRKIGRVRTTQLTGHVP